MKRLGNISFSSDLKKGGQGEGGQGDAALGQTVIGDSQFKELLSVIASNGANNQDQNQNQPNQQSTPVHTQLGFSEDQVSALEKALGKDGSESLMSAISGGRKQATTDSALLLQEIDNLKKYIEKSNSKTAEQLKSLGGRQIQDAVRVHGFDSVFTEENKEDIGEMLDIITANSNGFYDAKAAFDSASENGDVDALLKFKESFDDFYEEKYKDDRSVSGANGGSSASDARSSRTAMSEIDELKAKMGKLHPFQDVDKILELQQQVDQKAEEMIK